MTVLVGYTQAANKFALAVYKLQMVAVHMYRPERNLHRQVQGYKLVQDCKLVLARHNVS